MATSNQTMNGYAPQLREKANDCDFKANCDERDLGTPCPNNTESIAYAKTH